MKYLQYDQVDDTNDEFLTRLWFVFVFVINVLITHNFNKDCGYDFNSPYVLFVIDLLWIRMK